MFKINYSFNRRFVISVVLLIIVNVLLFFVLIKDDIFLGSSYPELVAVNNKDLNFDELSGFFNNLAEKKGGRYAFNSLKVANIKQNIDLHLLGHGIGDVLYKQEGINGISFCDNDFRNACSHSIVIGLFTEKGEGALALVPSACQKAPGGLGAYGMCFHGLGHGILAYEGYDMEKASKICQKTGTPKNNFIESTQCISGAVMEIIGGGFHDRESWEVERKKYLKKDTPLSLCQSSIIPNNAKILCYEYLTPYLFEVVGADLGKPSADDFEKAFKICNSIPISKRAERDSCYGGFGKEFDGLVQGRDIRQGSINSLSQDKLKQIYGWCLLAKNIDGINSCVVHALSSLYWGGENDRGVSIRFCGVVSDESLKDSCFISLIGSVSQYIKDDKYRNEFCSEIPTIYQDRCRGSLLN